MNDYYVSNAREYTEKAMTFDMSSVYDYFLPLLKDGAKILDLGCGCGRDLKLLKERGYDVIGLDASLPLVKIARAHSACRVDHKFFQNMDYENEFDGVLAIASLLHVPENQLLDVFGNVFIALKSSGFFFVNFQYGQGERTDDKGRLFNDMTESKMQNLLKRIPGKFEVVKMLKNDHDNKEDAFWLNIVLKKI